MLTWGVRCLLLHSRFSRVVCSLLLGTWRDLQNDGSSYRSGSRTPGGGGSYQQSDYDRQRSSQFNEQYDVRLFRAFASPWAVLVFSSDAGVCDRACVSMCAKVWVCVNVCLIYSYALAVCQSHISGCLIVCLCKFRVRLGVDMLSHFFLHWLVWPLLLLIRHRAILI